MKKFFSLLMGLFFVHLAFGQVHFTFSDDTGPTGGFVDIEVRVSGFQDVSGMQFSVNWDVTVAEYESIEDVTTSLPQFDINSIATPDISNIDDGELAVTWNTTSTQGLDLPDNHLLFTVRCLLVGDACDETDYILSDEPRIIEFVDSDQNIIDVTFDAGTAEVDCISGIIVNVPTVLASSGDNNVCLSITINNFQDMLVSQFPIVYPMDKLTFVSASSPLPDALLVGSVPGKVSFLWAADPPDVSESIPNGGEIVEVCFDVIGPSGSSAPITIPEGVNPEIDFLNSEEETVDYDINNGSINIQGGSSDLTLYFDDAELIKGQESCIPIRVNNFSNIQSMQFGIEWDISDLVYTQTTNYNDDMGIDEDGFNISAPGQLSFIDFDANGWTVPDGTILFEVCFTANIECDEMTEVEITGGKGGLEITNTDNEIVPVFLDPGTVTIICPCIVTNIDITPVTCFGDSDGAISFDVEGATGNFDCVWDNASITNCTPTGLLAGMYNVTITDDADCTSTASFTVGTPADFTFNATITDEVVGGDGAIDLTVTGGNGGNVYTWDNGDNTEDISNLMKGEYIVSVVDNKGCMGTSTAFVVDPKPLAVDNIDVTDVLCFGESTGIIALDVSGGCPAYTFEWEKIGEALTLPNAATISNLTAGSYSVTISDISTPAMQLVQMYTVDEGDEIVISNIQTVDSDGDNGSITLDVTGGAGDFTYLWTPGGFVTEDLSGIPGGFYVLQVTDANGCVIKSDTINVGSSYIVIDIDDTNSNYNGFGVSCNGMCDGSISGQFVVANGTVDVSIDGAATSWPILNLCAGAYELNFIDEKGITYDTTIVIEEPDAIEVTFSDVTCSGGSDGEATAIVTGGVEDYQFEWSSGTSSASVSNLPVGENITVLVTDANQCQFMGNLAIMACNDGEACYESNPVITPNADNKNDQLKISCLDNPDNILYIYDRYGLLVYSQVNYDNSWTGQSNSGSEVPENGYMWVLELNQVGGGVVIKTGTVTVLRNNY